MNARHDATLSLSDILATASASGAGCSLPHGRDVLIWGPIGNVKKALAAMGLGLDFGRTGKVQGIHDATGRRWGELTFCDTAGRASALLCYIMA